MSHDKFEVKEISSKITAVSILSSELYCLLCSRKQQV